MARYMANENGDWIQIDEASIIYILDTGKFTPEQIASWESTPDDDGFEDVIMDNGIPVSLLEIL